MNEKAQLGEFPRPRRSQVRPEEIGVPACADKPRTVAAHEMRHPLVGMLNMLQ